MQLARSQEVTEPTGLKSRATMYNAEKLRWLPLQPRTERFVMNRVPFGNFETSNLTPEQSSAFLRTTATLAESGVDNPYRFSTKEWDEKSGLYYFGARYYYPEIGRWTQRDPAGIADGLNLYAYVSNDPVSHVDPEGRKTKPTLTYQQEKLRQAVHNMCNLSKPKDPLDSFLMDQCCDALLAFFTTAVEAYPFAAIPVRNAYVDCTNIARYGKCHSGGWLVNRFFGHLRKKKPPRNLRDAWEEFLDYAWGKVFVSPRPRHPITLPRR